MLSECRFARRKQGKDASKPILVLGFDAQACWEVHFPLDLAPRRISSHAAVPLECKMVARQAHNLLQARP